MLVIANYFDCLNEKILSLYWDFFFLWYLLWFLLYQMCSYLVVFIEGLEGSCQHCMCSFHTAGAQQQWDLGFSISLRASEKPTLLCSKPQGW